MAYTFADLKEFVPYIAEQGYGAVYFTPLFLSSNHGYDTTDYFCVDSRIGTNEEFISLVNDFHKHDIKVYVDGVFNHVGRDFFAFRDLLEHGEQSIYKNWFKNISFTPSPESSIQYFPGDGFGYDGWEGNYDLIELDHSQIDVQNHLISAAKHWVNDFGVDGIRLDVAYLLPEFFLERLRSEVNVPMIGEIIHGDYNRILDTGVDSVTDYNLFKALWSGVKEHNLHEINWTLNKHQEEYQGKNLLTFLDNHDVSRVASHFTNESGAIDYEMLHIVYQLLFYVPGTPSVYYGSEIPENVAKTEGQADSDVAIRPHLELKSIQNQRLSGTISDLVKQKRNNPNLHGFDYFCPYITNEQMIFQRGSNYVCVNLSPDTAIIDVPEFNRTFDVPGVSCAII